MTDMVCIICSRAERLVVMTDMGRIICSGGERVDGDDTYGVHHL